MPLRFPETLHLLFQDLNPREPCQHLRNICELQCQWSSPARPQQCQTRHFFTSRHFFLRTRFEPEPNSQKLPVLTALRMARQAGPSKSVPPGLVLCHSCFDGTGGRGWTERRAGSPEVSGCTLQPRPPIKPWLTKHWPGSDGLPLTRPSGGDHCTLETSPIVAKIL